MRHLVVIGDARNMAELKDDSVQLVVTSPPYFNVKDYGIDNIGSINEYEIYLRAVRQVFSECYRVLQEGRYICVNVSFSLTFFFSKEKGYCRGRDFNFALRSLKNRKYIYEDLNSFRNLCLDWP